MIKGFIEETKPLSKKEIHTLRVMVNGLKTFPHGKRYHQTAGYFINQLKSIGITINEARFRKIIQYIRVNDLVLGICSDSGGYWITDDAKELYDTLKSLKDRITNQTSTFNALKRQYKKMFESKIKKNKELWNN